MVYRKIEDKNKKKVAKFFLPGPPTLPIVPTTTADPICKHFYSSTIDACLNKSSRATCSSELNKSLPSPIVQCEQTNCTGNRLQYICKSEFLSKPLHLEIPSTSKNEKSNYNRKKKRGIHHLKSVKTNHKLKRKRYCHIKQNNTDNKLQIVKIHY